MLTPIEGGSFRVTDIIGTRTHPVTGALLSPHRGLDITGISSQNIVAVKAGHVMSSTIVLNHDDATWEWGNYVKVTSDDGISIYYCHMAKRKVVIGQQVKAGDIIGIIGSTGQVTGPHLHIEARRGIIKAEIPASESDECNIAKILGIANKTGTYSMPAETDYADAVTKKCGLEPQTVDYINRYKFANILWKKLWEQMT